MNCQGQLMTQPPPPRPHPGLFKRNPPIAGEAEAIEAAKRGDGEAFARLYDLHKRRVTPSASACWATSVPQRT